MRWRTTIPSAARVERAVRTRAVRARRRGPRLADFAYLIWGTGSWNPRRPNQDRIDAAVNAYRRHVELTDAELDRLEAVMYIRTLYLVCFGYRRAVTNGSTFNEWGFIEPPEYFSSTAEAVRAASRRQVVGADWQ
jgi:Ser/Thr protein kinase RdoA (MazF antagonist)